MKWISQICALFYSPAFNHSLNRRDLWKGFMTFFFSNVLQLIVKSFSFMFVDNRFFKTVLKNWVDVHKL